MQNKNYFTNTLLLGLIGTPLLIDLSIFLGIILINIIQVQIFPIILAAMILSATWIIYIKRANIPDDFWHRFLPILISFCYYMMVWIVMYGIYGYKYTGNFQVLFLIFTIPYFLLNFIFSISALYHWFPFIQIGILFLITILMVFFPKNKKLHSFKKLSIYVFIIVFIISLSLYQRYDSSTKVLYGYDNKIVSVQDELNIYDYTPFMKNNKLKIPTEKIDLEISKGYPRLDGATAAYPVYAALAQSIYKGLNENTVYEYVQCSKTDEAYNRLINNEIDILFGAMPSKWQMKEAEKKGVKLNMTAVGKEAFVFIVNKDNSVDSLTIKQIQDIYSKKTVNWKDVGGISKNIMAFQRPENSGSQTIMEAIVMKDLKLAEPIVEENANIMEGLVSSVAEYRNYSFAIGYTFRYFVNNMYSSNNIKILAINGIMPTVENIKNGSYPFIIDVYAVTAGTKNENSQKIIDWILSKQGQRFIEECGYVSK